MTVAYIYKIMHNNTLCNFGLLFMRVQSSHRTKPTQLFVMGNSRNIKSLSSVATAILVPAIFQQTKEC